MRWLPLLDGGKGICLAVHWSLPRCLMAKISKASALRSFPALSILVVCALFGMGLRTASTQPASQGPTAAPPSSAAPSSAISAGQPAASGSPVTSTARRKTNKANKDRAIHKTRRVFHGSVGSFCDDYDPSATGGVPFTYDLQGRGTCVLYGYRRYYWQ
jgi:hypothetical protein